MELTQLDVMAIANSVSFYLREAKVAAGKKLSSAEHDELFGQVFDVICDGRRILKVERPDLKRDVGRELASRRKKKTSSGKKVAKKKKQRTAEKVTKPSGKVTTVNGNAVAGAIQLQLFPTPTGCTEKAYREASRGL